MGTHTRMSLDRERSFGRGDPVRDYWLAHAEGFRLADDSRTLGVVDSVDGDGTDPQRLRLRLRRRGLPRHVVIPAADVEEVVPARELLVLGRDAHGTHAARTQGGARVGVAVRSVEAVARTALGRIERALIDGVTAALAFASAIASALADAFGSHHANGESVRRERRRRRDRDRTRRVRRQGATAPGTNVPTRARERRDAPPAGRASADLPESGDAPARPHDSHRPRGRPNV